MTSGQEVCASSEAIPFDKMSDDETSFDETSDDDTPTDQPLAMFSHGGFTDPVLAYLSRTLSIRELVQLKRVSKQFAPWLSQNSVFTARARSKNDSLDRYFPLYLAQNLGPPPDSGTKRKRATLWVWSGLHHLTQEPRSLPSLEYLACDIIQVRTDRFKRCLLPSSGSLLLFVLKATNQKGDAAWNDKNLMFSPDEGWRAHWIPLLVSNPLIREYTVLPEPANAASTSWDYEGARAHLVEDERANAYKVLLVFRDSLFVYHSRTKCWISSEFKEPIPWGNRNSRISGRCVGKYYDVPCTISGGKLWYAELEVNGSVHPIQFPQMDTMVLTTGAVRLFEVDEKEGTWKPAIRYALKDFIIHDPSMSGFGFMQGSYAIKMVECMGGVYIVIPAILNTREAVGEDIIQMYNLGQFGQWKKSRNVSYSDYGFLCSRFHVVQLKGDGLPYGQALVQVQPGTRIGNKFSYASSLGWNPHLRWNPGSWFHCKGWGSVISIVFNKYIVRYNVMSGVSTTQVLSKCIESADVSYVPSFYIKP